MFKLFLGSCIYDGSPDLAPKTYHPDHEAYETGCNFTEKAPTDTREEREVKLLHKEYQLCKDAHPNMQMTSLLSSVHSTAEDEKIVQHPTKSEFLELVVQNAKAAGPYGYLGLYFSGTTFWATGDWAVATDDRTGITSISIEDIY